jgi:uncharacterized protein DUF6701
MYSFNKQNKLQISKTFFCMFICLFGIYSNSSQAAISSIAAEQSGTTSTGLISHVGSGALATRNNCGNINPSIPAGSVGDLLIAVALVRETNATVTMPGWTQYYTENHGATGTQDLEGYIFYRVATGGDPNTVTSGGAGNCRSLIGQISRFNGVDTASPFETDPILAGNSSTQNTNTVTTGTETTTSATALSVAVTFINDNATVTTADSFTESFDSPSGTGRDSAISLSYRQETSTGAKGAFTWGKSSGTDESMGVLFALTPDPALEGITINVPGGTITDDFMVAAISVRPSSITITPPSGWTLLIRTDQGTNSNSQAIYHRVATATEPTSYTWIFGNGAITGTAGGIVTYRGVDTSSPIDAFAGNVTANGTSHTANSINTTVANAMVISTHSFRSAETWTPPTGMTEEVDIASLATPNAAGIALEMNDVTQTTAGATGNKTATVAGNADTGVAHLVALTPIVVSGGITVTLTGNVDNINAGSISITGAAIGDPEATNTNTETVDNVNSITTSITTLTDNAWLIDTVGDGQSDSFTPGAGQTERWDESADSSTGAMSTKAVATAALDSMTQNFNAPPGSNRLAQAVIAVAPASSSTIAFDAVASANTGAATTSTLNWTHTLVTSETVSTKLIVGISIEEPSGCSTGRVSSVTFGNISLIQAATILVDDTYCHQVEIWYADLTNIIVSTNNNSTLGGQAIDQDEAVEYNALTDTGTLFFDDATFDANERLVAIHQYTNGNLAISTAGDASIGGNAFGDDDIVEVTPSGTAGIYDFVQILFDGGTHFASGAEDVDAAYVRDNGNIILSTIGGANLPGVGNFQDDDLVEWNPGTSTATMFLDESATGNLIPNAGGDEDIVGVHLLNDDSNLILFSLVSNNTIRGTAVLDGDVILYNRNTDTASIFFSESNFTSGGEDVDALTLAVEIVTNTVDHYAISYPLGTPGVTCEALAVRITAHGDPTDHSITVAPSNTTQITLSTSPVADGWTLKSGNGTFTAPDKYTFDGTETFVEFWLTETTATTAPHIDIDVTDGTATDLDGDVTEDVNIEFADAVFRFFAGGVGESIGTQIAGKESDIAPGNQTIQLGSVVTNTSTMACESRILNTQTIEMAYKCNNPTTCQGTPRLQIENAAAATFDITPGNDNASTVDATTGNYDNVDLDFGVVGTATFSFDFDDAGQIQLFARETLAAVSPDPAITVFGTSNMFVVKPAGLCVESTDTDSDCISADGTCTKFKKAGSVDAENFFNLTVKGMTWETLGETDSDFCTGTNVTTPNFQLSTIALAHTKIAPVGGASQDGTLSVTSLDISTNGTQTESSQAISEVGVFTVTATPPSYLGETISASVSANIGRFYPDRFNITMQNSGTLAFADSCSGFTYQHQEFYYNVAPILEITALNSNGITTNNYGGDFWKLTGGGLPRNYADGSGTPPAATLSSMTAGTITLAGETDYDGIGTLALQAGTGGDEIIYEKGVPEAEFAADVDVTFLTAGFQDTDHTAPNPVCYDATNDGTCDNFLHSTIGGTNLRWGKMVLGNGFGSELLPVEVPLSVEYFTADGFVINTLDTCTTYDSVDMSFSNVDGVTLGNLTLAGSGTLVNGVDDPANPVLASSTANEIGSADVTIDLTAQDWLQDDVDGIDNLPAADGNIYDDDPNSRITWGIFEGSDSFIYIRESVNF